MSSFFKILLVKELHERNSFAFSLTKDLAPQDQTNNANRQKNNDYNDTGVIPLKKNPEKELKTYKRGSLASASESKIRKLCN